MPPRVASPSPASRARLIARFSSVNRKRTTRPCSWHRWRSCRNAVETACKEGHLLQGRLHHIRKSAEPLALAPILQLHQATAVVRERTWLFLAPSTNAMWLCLLAL